MAERKWEAFCQEVDGYRVPLTFSPDAVRTVLKYKPQTGDFFVVSFPKCGTTWAQQVVSLIFDRGVSVSNYKEFNARTPFLEMTGMEAAEVMKKPGAMKLHSPYGFTPQSPNAKYLYVVRNPKDALVSFYHHARSFYRPLKDVTFEDFFEIFIDGDTTYGDYFDHILGWYEHRNDPNVMFLYYEELKRDTPNLVRNIAKFMGREYADMLDKEPEIFSKVLKYSSIEHMKCLNDILETVFKADTSKTADDKVPAGLKHLKEVAADNKPVAGETMALVRKGNVGGWRSMFSDDQNSRMDAKIEKRLKGTEMYDIWKDLKCI